MMFDRIDSKCQNKRISNESFSPGFMTTKGELVRAILFPPPLDFQFHSDFLKSIYVFLILGLIGMSYSLWMWISKGVCDKKRLLSLNVNR